jgi:hypothetical protein
VKGSMGIKHWGAPLAMALPAAMMVLAPGGSGAGKKQEASANPAGPAILWREPGDISTRDLYYGPGGKAHEPGGACKFVSEDMRGTSPKFEIACGDGVKWKAKLGVEARPEVAASRLLWAVGYFANEDYFVPVLQVEDMPHLRRGSRWEKDGAVRDVRLKRHIEGEKKIGDWSWKRSPFTETREWYGLRVLMAVMNSWDLKDVNNSIYQVSGPNPEQRYVVSDLGASFGTAGFNPVAKGNLEEYRRSKWIGARSGGFVDFNVPAALGIGWAIDLAEIKRRHDLLWIGHHIPVEHARWMGSLLARLSPDQLRDAFRAAGYTPAEAEGFTEALQGRIRELNSL